MSADKSDITADKLIFRAIPNYYTVYARNQLQRCSQNPTLIHDTQNPAQLNERVEDTLSKLHARPQPAVSISQPSGYQGDNMQQSPRPTNDNTASTQQRQRPNTTAITLRPSILLIPPTLLLQHLPLRNPLLDPSKRRLLSVFRQRRPRRIHGAPDSAILRVCTTIVPLRMAHIRRCIALW
jgi:hypothetical protein